MSNRNIFRKTCPSCATQVPTELEQCACGYSFLPTDPATSDAGGAHEVELYRAYLGARLEQAAGTLEAERKILAADPKNFDKAYRVMRALHEVQALRAEFDACADAAATETAPSQAPGAAFRAAQASKADRIMQQFEGTATKRCPKCQQTLPVTSALCLCGFAFAHDKELPSHLAQSRRDTEPGASRSEPST